MKLILLIFLLINIYNCDLYAHTCEKSGKARTVEIVHTNMNFSEEYDIVDKISCMLDKLGKNIDDISHEALEKSFKENFPDYFFDYAKTTPHEYGDYMLKIDEEKWNLFEKFGKYIALVITDPLYKCRDYGSCRDDGRLVIKMFEQKLLSTITYMLKDKYVDGKMYIQNK